MLEQAEMRQKLISAAGSLLTEAARLLGAADVHAPGEGGTEKGHLIPTEQDALEKVCVHLRGARDEFFRYSQALR